MSWRISAIDARWLDRLEELEHLCFGSGAWSRQSLVYSLEDPLQTWLGCFDEDRLAGCAAVQCVAGVGYIASVAVDPAYRRRGAGRNLLAAFDELAEREGLEELTLEVRRSNHAAIALYRGAGYAEVGAIRGYYDAPKEDALLMTKFFAGSDKT